MNADGLFRGSDSEKDPGIRQADLMKVLGHGKGVIQRFFVRCLRVRLGGTG